MAQRVAAIFRSRAAAERAAAALVDLGAAREQISMLARGESGDVVTTTLVAAGRETEGFVEPAREGGDAGAPLTTADEEDAAKGAATGAAIGAAAGLAAGAMALMVPGFGLVMAAGPLAWALGGAVGAAAAGAVVGGVSVVLRNIGIEEQYARGYEERIRGGDVLLTAMVPSIAEDRVLDVLAQHGAEDVSFADDTSIAQMPVSPEESRIPDTAIVAPSTVGRLDTPFTAAPPPTTPVGGPVTPGSRGNEGASLAGDTAAPSGTAGTMDRQAADLMDRPAPGAASRDAVETQATFSQMGREARDYTETVPSADSPTNYRRMDMERDTASYAESPVGGAATTGAQFDSNVACGEAKPVEREIRDRAADRTANPIDNLAAKGKKREGKIQAEIGEAQEKMERRQSEH